MAATLEPHSGSELEAEKKDNFLMAELLMVHLVIHWCGRKHDLMLEHKQTNRQWQIAWLASQRSKEKDA